MPRDLNNLDIRRLTDVDDPDVVALLAESDAYLEQLYPPESNHAESLDALLAGHAAFFLGYHDNKLVACGAVKLLDDDGCYGEIKRVFVSENQRGKNFATEIMQRLEEHLRDCAINVVRLEAGPRQPAALKFYRRLGYVDRGPFGRYADDPLSVFMEKTLS